MLKLLEETLDWDQQELYLNQNGKLQDLLLSSFKHLLTLQAQDGYMKDHVRWFEYFGLTWGMQKIINENVRKVRELFHCGIHRYQGEEIIAASSP